MISAETIALVKERTDLVALVAETVKLTRRGRSFVGLCPFHQEKTPSFHVNAERAFFHCFGCKESGGPIDFMMKVEGYGFAEAVRVLAERAGVQVDEIATDQERREMNAARQTKEELYGVNALAATFFEHSLRGDSAHPLAHFAAAELERRGLPLPTRHDEVGEAARIGDTLQAFRIGYAPFGWDGTVTFLRKQGVSPMVAEKVGLLVPRSSGSGHYDRFRHRLMFAVTDVNGRVVAFSGRALPEPSSDQLLALKITPTGSPPDAQPAKYVNSPESPIYTKGEHVFGLYQARQAIRQAGEAVLVEGNFDVVSLHARGVTRTVAPLGTAFTVGQAKLLKRFAPKVVILFDGDAAGRKATVAARVPCWDGGLDPWVASLPSGTDPDELVRTRGREALDPIIKNALGMFEYRINNALDNGSFRGASIDERYARIEAVKAILREERDPTKRALGKSLADRLSSLLIVGGKAPTSLRELETALEDAASAGRHPRSIDRNQVALPHDRARSRARPDDIALEVLGALLDYPELIFDPEVTSVVNEGLPGDCVLAVAALRRVVNEKALPKSRASTSARAEPGNAPGNEAGMTIGSDVAVQIHATEATSTGYGRQEFGIHTDDLLAQIPHSIHSFAAMRLASPVLETRDAAMSVLLENARKLSCLNLRREMAEGIEALGQALAQGDAEKENERLRTIWAQAAQKKHGIRGGQGPTQS